MKIKLHNSLGKIDIKNSWCIFDDKILIDFSFTKISLNYTINDSFCFLKFDFRKKEFKYDEGFGSGKQHPFPCWWKNPCWGSEWKDI